MSDQDALFSMENGGDSDLEREVADYIAALQEASPLTPAQRVVASMCRSLAKSITTGNRKGRSVANDVERLHATMQELSGTDPDDQTDSDLTPAERELFNALQSVPARNGDAEAGYTT